MDPESLRSKRRTYLNLTICAIAIALAAATQHPESALIVVLPGLVLHWIISNEFRLTSGGRRYQPTRRWTRIRLFILLPAFTLTILLILNTTSRGSMSLQGMWIIDSVALAVLLFRVYSRFVVIRVRLELPPETPQRNDGAISSSTNSSSSDQALRAYESRRAAIPSPTEIRKKVALILAVDAVPLIALAVLFTRNKDLNPAYFSWLMPVLLVVNFLILRRKAKSDETKTL